MRLVLLAAMLPLMACGAEERSAAAPADGATRSFALRDFTAVELRGSDDVEVQVGPAFSVRAEGNAAVLDRLDIKVLDGRLAIGRKRGMDFGGGDARIHVTLPTITSAGIAGSGDMAVDRVTGNALAASVAGSGTLTLGALAVGSARLSIAGSGDIVARGTAERLAVKVAGSGSVEAPQLTARAATVSIAGSGDVRATVKGAADVRATGSGDVDLGADARCTVRVMGSTNVRCGG